MLSQIIKLSIQYRIAVILAAGLLAGVGLASVRQLSISAFPDTTPVIVQVTTRAPSLGPTEIERLITYPLEQVLNGLPKMQQVSSISKTGLSQVTCVFVKGTDLLRARQLVEERLRSASLPKDSAVGTPQPGPITTAMGEVYHYLVTSDRHDLIELRAIQDWLIKPHLRTVRGVAEVNTWGGYEKQYHVLFDPLRLVKYDLTLDEVTDALRINNENVGGGSIARAGEMQLIQGVGRMTSLTDIADTMLKEHHGQPVRVRDVADVEIGHEIPLGAVTAAGRGEAVLGIGNMLVGANVRDVTELLRSKLDEVRLSLPPGVTVTEVLARSDLIEATLDTVHRNLLWGALIVVAALFLLGGSLRAALIVATAIPLSFFVAGAGMLQWGIAASLMTLGAIDFGILVEGSLIFVENSVRRLSRNDDGLPVADVVREACLEVRWPMFYGELIILAVYLPILTLEGIEGELFRPLAITMLLALGGSILVSLTLVPALASWLLPQKMSVQSSPLVRLAERIYRPTLELVLGHRRLVVCGVGLGLISAAALAVGLGTSFVPRLHEGAVLIATQRLASVSLEESIRAGTQLEKLLLTRFPDEVERVWTRTGTDAIASDPMGADRSDVFITLKPRADWRRAKNQDELVRQMEAEVQGLPGMFLQFTQPLEQRVHEMLTGISGDVGVKVFGHDFDQLEVLANHIADVIREIPGARDVISDQLTPTEVVRITVDDGALARYGVPRRDVLATVEALGTPRVGEVLEGERLVPMVVRLAKKYRADPEAIGQVLVSTAQGVQLPLSRLAKIDHVQTPTIISREATRRRVLVQCNVRGRDLGSFNREAEIALAKATKSWPEGYGISWSGQSEPMIEAQSRLTIIVPLTCLLVLFLLAMATGKLRDAVVIFSGVPFSALGGIVALWCRGLPLSISAVMGFITLFGVSVFSGLALVFTIRNLGALGLSPEVALRQAALKRLRPTLMSAAAIAGGFLPMMLSMGIGAEIPRPLATVVVGGMASALMLTLLVLPVLYSLFGAKDAIQAERAVDPPTAG